MVDVQAELRTWITRFATGDHDIANLLCERHAEDSGRLALRYEDADGHEEQLTYRELADLSARFASRLAAAGVGRGDRVATLLPRCPELLIVAVGLGFAAGLFAFVGRDELLRASPVAPTEAIEIAKEDLTWIWTRARSGNG